MTNTCGRERDAPAMFIRCIDQRIESLSKCALIFLILMLLLMAFEILEEAKSERLVVYHL